MDDKFRDKMRGRLEISTDGIDDCLIEQPIFFYDVASAYAEAVAKRDEAKLELKEVFAELYQLLRKKYLEQDVKVTEAALDKEMNTLPRIQTLNKEVVELTAEAEKWLALKEAYVQRSFMLRELVAKLVSELNNLGLERRASGPRSDLADARRANSEAQRRERIKLRG